MDWRKTLNDARFIFLLRHPGAIVRSRQNPRPGADDSVETILEYGRALERACVAWGYLERSALAAASSAKSRSQRSASARTS